MSITIWRRHTPSCPHKARGRDFLKCSCPVWADGYVNGVRTQRKSLGTRDLARARKKAIALESDERIYKTISDAIAAFLGHCESNGIGESTRRKYANSLNHLETYCDSIKFEHVNEISTAELDAFRSGRKLKPITSSKELQLLRQFCGFCFGRRWMDSNPAKDIKMPRNLKPNEVEPFTAEQIAAILHAAGEIGQQEYERRRARAMVLLHRYTALRIGDVAMFSKDRVFRDESVTRIFLRTEKNGKPIFLPVPQELTLALDAVPKPKGTTGETVYYFWNGISKVRSIKKSADDTLRSVFRKSKVPNAHAHRFRHTLATELLGKGASLEEVADILGNSPDVVRKHYAKWSVARQSRIDELMGLVHTEAVYAPKLKRVK